MRKNKMTQRCKFNFVPGTANWENFMWPHQLDKTAPPPPQPTGQSMTNSNIVQGNQAEDILPNLPRKVSGAYPTISDQGSIFSNKIEQN